jgi:hypothetical protein
MEGLALPPEGAAHTEASQGTQGMRRTILVAAAAVVLMIAVPAGPAHASDHCTVALDRVASDLVEAVPSAGCGPVNLAVYRYASTAPGVWSPGTFAFGRTLPQTLASSSTGTGVLRVGLPCGSYQVDAWSASGPPVPASITASFLGANSTAIRATYLGGLHSFRFCAPDTGGPFTGGGPDTGGPTTGGIPTGSSGPFLSDGASSGLPPSITGLVQLPPPEVRSDRTTDPRPTVLAEFLGSSGSGGAGILALALVVAALLVALLFRSPLPSTSTERWTT